MQGQDCSPNVSCITTDGLLDRNELPGDDPIREGRNARSFNQHDLDKHFIKDPNHIEAFEDLEIITGQPWSTKTHQGLHLPYLDFNQDMRSLFEDFKPIHKEPSYASIWYGFVTQLSNSSKWNQPNWSSDDGFIQFTKQAISNLLGLDIRELIGDFRPNHEALSCKPTCSTICIQQRFTSCWNQAKINFGLGVIQFLNQRLLGLPYLESHEFPYLEAFTLGALTIQRLFLHHHCCILKILLMNLDTPKAQHFLPKLSRYKSHDLPYLD